MRDRCDVPGCRNEAELEYLDRGVCGDCWNRWTAEDAPLDALRMVLGLGADAPAALEADMSEIETAATAATEGTTMATKKKTATKATKKAAPKAAKPAKAVKAKAPKAKREKVDQGDLVTFAVRLPKAEAEALHAAAGPRNASRFAKALFAAFAAADPRAFQAILAEAKEARTAKA